MIRSGGDNIKMTRLRDDKFLFIPNHNHGSINKKSIIPTKAVRVPVRNRHPKRSNMNTEKNTFSNKYLLKIMAIRHNWKRRNTEIAKPLESIPNPDALPNSAKCLKLRNSISKRL